MRYFILFIVFIIFSNCVSTKVFNDLESGYAKVKIERNNLLESQDSLQQSWDKLNNFLIETRENLQISRDSYNASLKKIKIIRDEFNLLKENSNLIDSNIMNGQLNTNQVFIYKKIKKIIMYTFFKGNLTAVGYHSDNSVCATHTRITSGAPHEVRLSVEFGSEINANR